MKTIVILTRRADAAAEDLARLSKPELLAVWKGMAQGTVRAAHGLLEGAGAVLELETATLEDAKHYVKSLPYVEENLLDVQYCPLKPFPAFDALAASPGDPMNPHAHTRSLPPEGARPPRGGSSAVTP